MPVRIRITSLFALVVFVILGLVCVSIYYFSYESRVKNITTRLRNRAITTGRLLGVSELSEKNLITRIDSLTTLSLRDKSVQVCDYSGVSLYSYTEHLNDTVAINKDLIDKARTTPNGHFFNTGIREAIAYNFTGSYNPVVIICAARDEDGINNLGRLRGTLIINFMAGVFIACIGGYFFAVRLLKPIRNITKEVTEISAQNLTRRIRAGKIKDEWHHMSATLNELLDRLQESFELQRRFISNASHELSTPLTAISGQLEIALQRNRESEEYEKIIRDVLEDVRRMNKLTQTLLEFAKAEGNRGGLSINLVRIDEILMELPGRVQKQGRNHEVFLEFNSLPESDEDLLVFGNQELLTAAIHNIVSNACKYSPDHKAKVGFSIADKYFVITIFNKGEIIPADKIPAIFQPFYRIHEEDNNTGFGLGLSLAYRIIKLHKGDISVISDAEGTIFRVHIPSAKKSTL
jgi:two-component system, OmpR family, sensor histidine kinase ArlS